VGMEKSSDLMESACEALANASTVVVFSGAGISAESGISTFRDPEMGLWTNKIGLAMFGTPFGWWLMPETAWGLYLSRFRDPIAKAQPNDGHYAIAKLEKILKAQEKEFHIITQNVDGLHQRAGNSEDLVYELHGTINRHKCSKHGHVHNYVVNMDEMGSDYDPLQDEFFTHDKKKYPKCEECKSYLRPDCVLFTEPLPYSAWSPAQSVVDNLKKGDVMIVVGTSGVVYPAASLAEHAINLPGVCVIEVNPETSTLSSHVDIFLKGPSGKILPELVSAVAEATFFTE